MIHIAVIGHGYWGPKIVKNLKKLSGVSISWICDSNPKKLLGIPKAIRTTTAVSDIYTDKGTDAVVIVTPPSTHFHLAKNALLSNKHVLVEKPMTSTTKEAKELLLLAHSHNKTLMVDHTFLYTPAIQALRDIILKKTLGTISSVESIRTNLGVFQKDTNVIFDLGSHDFSIMEYLFKSKPISVRATGIIDPSLGQETSAHIEARYPGHILFHAHVSWISPVKTRRITIVGTKKIAVFDDMEPKNKIKLFDKNGSMTVPKLDHEEALMGVVSEFRDALSKHRPPRTDGAQGTRVVGYAEATTTSLRKGGKTITL
jgi:predicted dehydrogenase